MRKIFFLFLWLSCLPYATRGQTIEDIDLSELLQPIQAKALCYWYDDNTDDRLMVNNLSSNYTLDVSSLKDGLHILYYQVIGTDNISYGTTSQIFFKMTASEEFSSVTLDGAQLKYWYDEDTDNIKAVNNLLGIYSLDVSSLSDGLHTLHALLVGADGTVCSTMSDVFIKDESIQPEESLFPVIAARRVAYWFDDDANNIQVSKGLSGTYKIDASSLSDGLHLLHYYVVGEDGLSYGITSTMFLKNESIYAQKIPNGITKYTYWLNDCSTSVQTVTLDKTVNPYTLMALLPAPHQPIRSTKFHFQVEDGVPTIYAKNDFHIRFYDARGEFVDNFMEEEKTYVDYGVSQQVTEAELLVSGNTATIPKPAENTIKWYYLTAEPGDSLEFKLDHAASIQLFSPSGEEVYHAAGAESVKWGGCHVEENGEFYLGLHDATATNGSTINLDYNHIDKYAVLRQSIKQVGNGGYSTIKFEGNGFRDLYAIDIIDAEQSTIECVSLGIESNASITPTFDFTSVKLGVYDALFHFTEEDVLVKDAINVVEAKDITIDTKLETPVRLFGRGSNGADVMIVCPNGGNNTAYGVPVEVSITAPKGSITRIDITNPEVPTLAQMLYNEELSGEDWNEIQQISDQVGDTYDFLIKEWVDEITGTEMVTMMIYMATTIEPESSNTINLKVQNSSDFEVEVDSPKDWMPVYNIEKIPPVTNSKNCGFLEAVKCFVDGIAAIGGVASTIGTWTPAATATGIFDCAASTVSSLFGMYTINECGQPQEAFNPDAFKTVQKTACLWSPILSCVLRLVKADKFLSKAIVSTLSGGNMVVSISNAIDQCRYAFGNKQKGVSVIRYSKDPNDIIGYQSPSGSKYISQDVKDISYTIEFENDPEVATAPAHDIYLTDELDANKFDLSSYKPTQIRIGNKTAELSGEKNFVTTVDMRPEIYAIAQVEGTFNESTGIMNWHISSLDPMTMEPTNEIVNGILPVNTDGLGMGEASFDIRLKDGLAHGTEIPNKATIVFDMNEPIETPTWVNIIDTIRPTSHIVEVTQLDGQTAEVTIEAMDELSGPWRYDVYVQYGPDAPWWKVVENVPADTTAAVRIYKGIDHGFYVVATDSAGNVERKEPIREMTMNVPPALRGDVNDDEEIGLPDVMLIVNYILGIPESLFIKEAADVNKDGEINMPDVMFIINYIKNGKFPDE